MILSKIYIREKMIQALLFVSLVSVWGCGQGKYNTIDIDDPNAGSEYVYGKIDGPPLQADNEYPADPDAGARINTIRKQMFGDRDGAEPGLQQANPGQTPGNQGAQGDTKQPVQPAQPAQ